MADGNHSKNRKPSGLPERRRLRQRLLRCALLLAASPLALALLSCNSAPPTIAVIPRTCGTILWEAEHTGVERAARKLGLYVYWNAPMREDDVQGQIDILAHALTQNVRGVIISPVEALPLRSSVHRALVEGMPVVVVGTDLGLTPSRNLAYVLSDERSGGQIAARRIAALLHGQGSIAILGINKRLTSTAERSRSLEATLEAESPRIHVVFRSMALPTVAQEQETAERLLADAPQIDAIVALTENSTRGAFYALTEFNKAKTIPLVGFDQNLLAPIGTGAIDSVIFQDTDRMGRAAVELMQQELHGGAKQGYVTLPPVLVTHDNIESKAVQEILDLSWFQ